MQIIGERLKTLRESMKLSQQKVADMIGCPQTSVYRYETGNYTPSAETLLWYADYFDVSLDYLFGRCDEPEGRLYKHQPKIGRGNPDMQRFVEMCFDPASPMNARLKEALFKMLEEET